MAQEKLKSVPELVSNISSPRFAATMEPVTRNNSSLIEGDEDNAKINYYLEAHITPEKSVLEFLKKRKKLNTVKNPGRKRDQYRKMEQRTEMVGKKPE